MSQQIKRTFNIFHKLTCKSQYVIYLMECILCKIQYGGKSETPFNLRLNNHRKDVYNPKAIPVCNHFKIWPQLHETYEVYSNRTINGNIKRK